MSDNRNHGGDVRGPRQDDTEGLSTDGRSPMAAVFRPRGRKRRPRATEQTDRSVAEIKNRTRSTVLDFEDGFDIITETLQEDFPAPETLAEPADSVNESSDFTPATTESERDPVLDLLPAGADPVWVQRELLAALDARAVGAAQVPAIFEKALSASRAALPEVPV